MSTTDEMSAATDTLALQARLHDARDELRTMPSAPGERFVSMPVMMLRLECRAILDALKT